MALQTGTWNDITYGVGKYVAVGSRGIFYSRDSINWLRTNLLEENFQSVLWDVNKFVAMSNESIASSIDGVTWTRSEFEDDRWNKMVCTPGLYIAGKIKLDVTHWWDQFAGLNILPQHFRTTWSSEILCSTNGIDHYVISAVLANDSSDNMDYPNWDSGYQCNALAYGNNRYVFFSGMWFNPTGGHDFNMTSPDGINWQEVNIQEGWKNVIFANKLFFAIGDNYLCTSSNGLTWTPRSIPVGNWKNVNYIKGLYIAVGENCCATSPDGITWTARTIPAGNWNGMAVRPASS